MAAQISSCSYREESGLGTRLLHECVKFLHLDTFAYQVIIHSVDESSLIL